MSIELQFQPLSAPGSSILDRVLTEASFLGRDVDNVVIIDSSAVSRKHGYFFKEGYRWLYRDLNSSNGSWINSVAVPAGQSRLLREGDILRVGDFKLRIVLSEPTQEELVEIAEVSVLLFRGDRFLREEPLELEGSTTAVPEDDGSGRASRGEIQLTRQGNTIDLRIKAKLCPVRVNGYTAQGEISLVDRDEVVFGLHKLLINNPLDDRAPSGVQGEGGAIGYNGQQIQASSSQAGGAEPFRAEEASRNENSRRKGFDGKPMVFGRESKLTDVTAPTVRYREPGYASSTSNRFSAAAVGLEHSNKPKESRVTIALGVMVLTLLVGGLLYLVYSSI